MSHLKVSSIAPTQSLELWNNFLSISVSVLIRVLVVKWKYDHKGDHHDDHHEFSINKCIASHAMQLLEND